MLRALRLRRVTRAALLAAGAAVGTGCGSGADLGISSVLVVASVEVTPSVLTLVQHQTHTFVANPRTSSGVPVTGRAVTWSSSDPGVATIAADGRVTALTPGTTRITARVDGVSGSADLTVSIVPVDLVELLPKATTVVIGSTVQLTANVFDADGGVLTGRPLTWSSSEVLIATVSSDGLVTTHGVGQVTITASVEGKSGAATITVGPRPAAKLGFLTQPSEAVAGVAMSPAVRVAIQDATGATVSAATSTVTLTLGAGTTGATLGGTVSAAAVNGVATFPNLSMTKAGTGYTLVAKSANLTDATSGPFVIRAAAAARIDITTEPASAGASGAPLSPQPVVQLADQFGNPVPQAGVVVTASLASGTGTLTSATATTSATGSAAFNSLAITGVPGTYALAFSAPGLAGETSTTIALSAGAASQLAFVAAPPTTATNGQPFTVTVGLRDAAGNPVSQAGVAVTVSLASGAGVLSGPPLTATTDASGVASFPGLVITGLPGPYTLAFAAAGMSTLTSGTLQLAAGSPTQLILTVAPPANAVSGVALVPGPAVRLADVSGNFVSTAGVQVTATLATGTGSLAGATATTDATGTATFPALTITGPAGSYSLTFAAPGLTSVTTASITVASGSPTQLTYTVAPPATAASGQPLNPQPVLQLRDASGNAVLQAGVQVTASAAGLTLTGESVTTNANGEAAFTSLTLSGATGTYNLAFGVVGVPSSISSSISLTAGSATQLTVSTAPPATTTAGQPFSATLQIRDAGGNAVAVSGVAVTAAIASGPGGTLSGTLNVATNASGVASFPDLVLTGTLGDYTLTFTAAGLSAATATVKLVAGAPGGITLTTQPSASAKNDEVFATQPVVTVTDGAGNPISGAQVTASIASAPPATTPPISTPTLGGTVTLTTNASGIAAFTNLEIVGPIGDYTLQFTAGGQTVTSGTLTLLVGVETQLVITVQPSNVTLLAAISPAPTVELRDSGNNLVPVDGRLVTVSVASGNSTFLLTPALTAGGVAVFGNIVMLTDGQGNMDHTLLFTAGALSKVSNPFKAN
jgi:hypothetical protein